MKESLMVWLRQCKLLIRKDYILARRNLRSSLISMMVPFIFVAFLVVLQYAFENNQRRGDLIRPVREGALTQIPKIPRCALGPDVSKCHTLAYTPNNDAEVTAIMEAIKTENDIPDDEVLAFETGDDLDRYLMQNPNSTQGAYHFFTRKDSSDAIEGMRYVIQYNQTITRRRGKRFDPSVSVLIPMQKSVDLEIMKRILGSDTDVDYSYYPFAHPEIDPLDVVATSGPVFFFGALMFNFVIQLGRLVAEKEMRLRIAMQLMGLQDSAYWLTALLNAFFFNTVSVLTLIASGHIFGLRFFTKNDFGLYFFLFFLFGLSMAPLALLLSVFVSKARTATVLGFGVFLVGSIIQGFSSLIFEDSVDLIYRIIFSLLPFALLSKGMDDLGKFSDNKDDEGLRWSNRYNYTSFFAITDTYGWLVLDAVIFLLLAVYLDKVLPNENGMREKPFYFLKKSYWFPESGEETHVQQEEEHSQLKDDDIDPDVLEEIKGTIGSENDIFRLHNLKKTFYGYTRFQHDPSKDFHAVRGLYLSIPPKTLFCLLGHNGAGKTTTINVLTGQMDATHGDAVILGNSIRSQMGQIQKRMGVCPQYDVLWPQLTGQEHLELFAGFKNVSSDRVAAEVRERLEDVDLVSHKDNMAGNYSGGMKRRLSVAIALTGDPGIVYLDEPTTGMDPVSRRKVWDLIERIKHDRVTILTTHSMEEADVLGDRIGIMKAGRFVCIGSSLHLKNRFGKGYRITIRAPVENLPKVEEFLRNNIEDSSIIGTEETSITFNVPRHCLDTLPQFFQKLEDVKSELGIFDIQLNLATLEEVFLEVGGLGEHDDRQGEQENAEPVVGCLAKIKAASWKKKLAWVWSILATLILLIAVIVMTSQTSDEPADLKVFNGSPALSALDSDKWNDIRPGGDTRCSRGDEFSFFVKKGDANKIIVEFQGGGVCWDSTSCDSGFGTPNYNTTVDDEFVPLRYNNYSGIFDQNKESNPVKGWTHIYIPHCTADYFFGNITQAYDAGLSIRHVGALNADAVLKWVFSQYGSVSDVFISGWGAGAFGASLWSGKIAEQYSSSTVTLFVDSATDVTSLNATSSEPVEVAAAGALAQWRQIVHTTWNFSPSWTPVTALASVPSSQFTLETIIQQTAAHFTSQNFRVARFNYALDQQQSEDILAKMLATPIGLAYMAQTGGSASAITSGALTSTIMELFCSTLKTTETTLVTNVASGDYGSFIGTGNSHGILNLEQFYQVTGISTGTTEVKLDAWLNDFIAGTTVHVNAASCTSSQ